MMQGNHPVMGGCLLLEESQYLFHDLLDFGFFLRRSIFVVKQAFHGVIFQYKDACFLNGGANSRQLDENVAAGLFFFHHSLYAGYMSFDIAQASQYFGPS